MGGAVQAGHDLKAVGQAFEIPGEFIEASPYGSGHINDTYAATYIQGGARVRYIHQRINHHIFLDPPGLMENVSRVTRHQLSKLGVPGPDPRCLFVLAARGGLPYFQDAAGNFWRSYHFIEGAQTYDVIESCAQAHEAARAFGEFQRVLADLPGPRLNESIPDFHNTPWRLENLEKAVAEDRAGRLPLCQEEAEGVLSQRKQAGRLREMQAQGLLPERVTHNDTKLNNVMMDAQSGKAVCVIDLDTVMPGLAAYDFGELVRTATTLVAEDEADLGKVLMQWDKFEALAQGYISGAGAFLEPAERETLAFGGWLMAFENGTRFLTDHLNGDIYYKIRRPGQNLARARTQLALARDIWKNLDKMNGYLASL